MSRQGLNRRRAFARVSPGFTLMEIIVVLAIFIILAIGIADFGISVFQYNQTLSSQLDANHELQHFLVQIERELHTASPSSLGAYPIESATATSLVYYANIDGDSYKERIRFFRNASTIQRGVIKPSGSPLTYNPANESISTVVQNVTNSDIFTFYDQNYDGTSAPLTFPVTTTTIRLVKIRAVVDRDPVHAPSPFEGVTSVEIRNLKLN